jgi:hypothetical protein
MHGQRATQAGGPGHHTADAAQQRRYPFTVEWRLERPPAKWAPKVLARTLQYKKTLVDFGVAKSGNIRPEIASAAKHSGAEFATAGSTVNTMAKIQWRGTRVPAKGFLRSIGLKVHSFIVMTDHNGMQKYISAHTDGQVDPQAPNGRLKATVGDYTPETSNFDANADNKTLETGQQVENKFPAMETAANEVSTLNLPYKVLSQNCNRAAYHILNRAGVRIKNPGGLYVGWGKMLTATAQAGGNPQDQRRNAVDLVDNDVESGH